MMKLTLCSCAANPDLSKPLRIMKKYDKLFTRD
jgi:hypothetical protein